jgi:Organic solute transport protein 1
MYYSMGFKHQIISLKSPQQFIQLTLVHLEKLKEMVNVDSVIEVINSAIQRLISTYGALKEGEWMILKQSIMRFMQGKRIKVSLFLQQSLQTMNGVLILVNEGVLPYGTEAPGSRKFYEADTMVHRSDFSCPAALERVHVADTLFDYESALGQNMYLVDSNSASKTVMDSLIAANAALTRSKTVQEGDKKTGTNRGQLQSSSKRELTMLADLLGMGSGSHKEEHHDQDKPFKINLFPDTRFGDKDPGEGKSDHSSGFIMIDIDGSAGGKTFEEYLQDLDLKDAKAGSKNTDDDDDLLALMDSAK